MDGHPSLTYLVRHGHGHGHIMGSDIGCLSD